MSFQFTAPIPLGLYIHLPWCVKKCPYCDFNSYARPEKIPDTTYVDALLKDLEHHLPEIWGRRIQSIFLGGGTPSLFPAREIKRLLSGIRAMLPVTPGCEITLEANPGTVEQERFNGFREAGVNRLSIGIQSFNDRHLKSLGRIHDSSEAQKAAEIAASSGFQSMNLDFMFGLPKQSLEECLQDLEAAIRLQPQHISFYQLTLEPNTEFHAKPPRLPGDDLLWEMQQAGQSLLSAAGYRQYEVSAYARQGFECQHNLNYWEFGDYLAIGAGAHGKLTFMDKQQIQRYWNYRQPGQYLDNANQNAVQNYRNLAPQETIFEFMLNAFRLRQGFSLSLFNERTGLDSALLETTLQEYEKKNLIYISDEKICPTDFGLRFTDDLIAGFLPAND